MTGGEDSDLVFALHDGGDENVSVVDWIGRGCLYYSLNAPEAFIASQYGCTSVSCAEIQRCAENLPRLTRVGVNQDFKCSFR